MPAPALAAERQRPAVASGAAAGTAGGLDVERLRAQFPILAQEVHGHPLVYLDNAASSQRPEAVIDAISDCYRTYYANAHRGVHALSERSTDAYEAARGKVARFIGAAGSGEVIFTRGTTEEPQPGRPELRPAAARSGRRGAAHRDGAPLEHRPLAARLRADRRPGAGGKGNGRRRTRPRGHGRPHHGAHEGRRGDPRLQRPRHRERHRRRRPSGARPLQGGRRRRWGAGRAPHGRRRVRARLRLLRLLRPQDVRPRGIGALWGRGELLASMPPTTEAAR